MTTDRVREILGSYHFQLAIEAGCSAYAAPLGRNSLQRKKPDALKFLGTVMGLYAGTQK
jgi:hypothetical protein